MARDLRKTAAVLLRFSVKLPESGGWAPGLPFTEATDYGLGKSGWMTATIRPREHSPLELLRGWIEESYRAVAPKKLAAQLKTASS